MSDSALLLGVDVGTTGTKAAIFNPEGELIALGKAEYASQYLPGNRVEQNPEARLLFRTLQDIPESV